MRSRWLAIWWNGDDATEIIFPDSLFDLRGADVAKAGLKAGSGRSRQKVRLIGEDGFDAKTVTIGEVPDRGGRVDESRKISSRSLKEEAKAKPARLRGIIINANGENESN